MTDAKAKTVKGQSDKVRKMYEELIVEAEKAMVRDFLTGPRKKSMVYATRRSKDVRMLAIRDVCLVQLSKREPWLLLTSEDVKSLEFVAMFHSMWHFYGATIAMEYIEPIH